MRQKTFEAARETVDDLLLPRLARREVECGLAGVDTELLGVRDRSQDLRRLE